MPILKYYVFHLWVKYCFMVGFCYQTVIYSRLQAEGSSASVKDAHKSSK